MPTFTNHAQNPPSYQAVSWPLTFDRNIAISLHSSDVEWKGNVSHLLRLGNIQFHLEKPSGHLKADIKGSITTFDHVTYEVSAAVFDVGGKLLGTARTPCEIERLWLGRVAMQESKLSLDFGNSLNYANAASFLVSISKCKVLTPDDWRQK